MISFHKPRFGLDFGALPSPSGSSSMLDTELDTRPRYSYVSDFRSLLLDIQLYSSSVKMVKQFAFDNIISCPVFGDHDRVEGKIILNPACSQSGRLIISMEGVFEYTSVNENLDDDFAQGPKFFKHQNVFLASSVIVPISPIPDPRSAFGVRKRPSQSSLNGPQAASRSCEFTFEIPRGGQPGEGMPSTFSSMLHDAKGRHDLSFVEKAEVFYRITAVWEPSDMSENRGMLEVPILFHSDTDFQCMDCSKIGPELWLEMPLIPERSIPFHCAVALPRLRKFSRGSSIPYYVVFTTTPRCPILAREIAADATISISLVRKIIINPRVSRIPLDSSDDSDGSSGSFPISRRNLLKRTTKPLAGVIRAPKSPEEPFAVTANKPLPELPQASFSKTRTSQGQVQIGFPKCPRYSGGPEGREKIPDGLYKGKIQLSKDMIPGIDWHGVSIKYYLDITVLFGQDIARACIPIQVL